MSCLSPRDAWFTKNRHPRTGNRTITFDAKLADRDLHVTVPCQNCRWCRLENSRQFAIRVSLETTLYKDNCFLTLTYAPEHLPKGGTVDKTHPEEFMKNLREYERYHYYKDGPHPYPPPLIRSFGCAEYGEKNSRPHYHICILNYDFADKIHVESTKRGDPLFESELLNKLWPHGRARIGALNFETAAYVARYVTKKINGPKAVEHYGDLAPERSVCISRRPGLGAPWFDIFHADVYPFDEIVLRGKKMNPPKYFDKLLEKRNPKLHKQIKARRRNKARNGCCGWLHCLHFNPNKTSDRLLAIAKCLEAKFQLLERAYEK